jgi:hypothetical protein
VSDTTCMRMLDGSVRVFSAEPDIGLVVADPWKQPTGAHDAYTEGFMVQHNGSLWVSLHPANVWEPPTQWEEYIEQESESEIEIPQWVQPTGGHDAYAADAEVMHNDIHWINTHGDGNVWEPGVAGWTEVV